MSSEIVRQESAGKPAGKSVTLKRALCHINLARGYRGGERQTELLIKALAARGVVQRLIVRRGQPLVERLRGTPGLTIVEIDKPFALHARHARGYLLHAHDGHGAKFAAAASLLVGAPYIVTRRISKQPSRNIWTRTVYRRAAAVVAVAGSVARDMHAYMPRLEPVVIHSALGAFKVDRGRRDAIRERWAGRFLVVNVAALVHSQKGQRHLIAVARRLASARPDMVFVLLGEGADRAALEALAADLPNVVFEGFVENVGDYLDAADAFVLPSLHEGIGGACLDAMYFGLPIVASAVDGVPEIVGHEDNGLLVAPADEQALFDALCRVYDERVLADELGRRGRVLSERYTPDQMAERYLEVYARVG
ncbi:glycosyltransferase family 4 protein [Salinisphaera sp.]|uniref:glycosyltransferase family 4 protein n=1 Tax=Salinisphaera sp. TaxID=1914330 RepID=UPI000C60CFC9|nr:glycosyltransferase family 4 protein [Salinisphaera sp.]MBS63839.1 glycosyl transferase [Salinisphaera sp.]